MRVMVAVDLGKASEGLVDRAVEWAGAMGGTLHLRAVSRLLGDAKDSVQSGFVAEEWEKFRRWERGRIAALADRVPSELRGEPEVVDGTPWRVLSELSVAFDLTVVGTHGRTGMARMFLGSVAERIVRHASGPVLVLPDEASAVHPGGHLRVVCPVDIAQIDLSAARWVQAACGEDVHYEFLHVMQHGPWVAEPFVQPVGVVDQQQVSEARARLRDMVAAFELGTSREELRVGFVDNVGDEIASYAEQISAHLIAMPTHGRRGVSRMLLGSVTERTMRVAGCPVLVIR